MRLLWILVGILLSACCFAQESRIAELERRLDREGDITALDEMAALGRAAVPALMRAVKSEDVRIRCQAIKLVAKYDEAEDMLIALVKDKNRAIRISAVEGLGYRMNRSLIGLFVDAMGDSDSIVRYVGVEGASHLGDYGVPYLIKALDDSNEYRRQSALRAMGHSLLPSARAAIRKAVHDPSYYVRDAAVADCEASDKEDLKLMIETLGDYWARKHPPAAPTPVHEMFQQPGIQQNDPGASAVYSLCRFHSEEIMDTLIERLKVDDNYVRYECTVALESYAHPKAIKALESILPLTADKLRKRVEDTIANLKERLANGTTS